MIYACGKEKEAEKRPMNIDECSVHSPTRSTARLTLLKEGLD
jgi:hypothetical protein